MESLPGNRLIRFLVLLRRAFASLFKRRPPSWTSGEPTDWPRPPIPREHAPALTDLQRVIPIVASQTQQDLTITLISLECYAEGLLLHGRYSPKYGAPAPDNAFFALPIVTAHDDVGTTYRWRPQASGHNRFSCVFAPALHPEARELRLEVLEVRWTFPQQQRHLRDVGPWSYAVAVPGTA